MSNLTTASTVLSTIVLAGATALALVLWRASDRVADRRLRFIAAGFAFLAAKSAFSIYTIQLAAVHHDLTEMIGTLFDVAIVASMAAPLVLRD